MIYANYDQSKHFTKMLVECIKVNFPKLDFSIFPESLSGGKVVVWETNKGYYEHIVPALEKEEFITLVETINESQ